MRARAAMHSPFRALPAIALGLVLVACAEASPSPTPGITEPTPTTFPAGPTADATPTDSPSPSVTAGPTDDADTPEGWQRITVAEAGFSVAVPADWEELSPDAIGDSGVMEQMRDANPDAAAVLEQAQAAIESGQIALFAFDTGETTAETGFATNLNVIRVEAPGDASADEVAEQVATSIREQIPVTGEVETGTAELPAGEAAVLGYEWQLDDGGGTTVAVSVTQYAVLANSGTGYILSMSVASEAAAEFEETFRQIAESFREEPA